MEVATGEYGGSVNDFFSEVGVLGGPMPQIISAMQTGIDPFTGREINQGYRPAARADVQADDVRLADGRAVVVDRPGRCRAHVPLAYPDTQLLWRSAAVARAGGGACRGREYLPG